MSNYQDIYRDLPSRVCEVWLRTKTHPVKGSSEDRSVTAMLMAAATGLAMPFENLKEVGAGNRKDWNSHPAFNSIQQSDFKAVLKKCNDFLEKNSSQCPGLGRITILHCQELSRIRDAVENGRGDKTINIAKENTRFAIKIIRNALAHNNLLAFGASNDQIEKLSFFSENRTGSGCKSVVDGWHVLTIDTKDFEEFLDTWFDLLKGPGSYGAVAKVSVDDATGQTE